MSRELSSLILPLLISIGIISVKTCPVYLTISPNGRNAMESFLEVNWGPNCQIMPQWIGIFREDPSISDNPAVVTVETRNQSSGYYLTKYKLGQFKLPGGWDRADRIAFPMKYSKGKCLNYYVASFKGRNLLSVNCLKIQPTWMRMNENIPDMPLKDLFIPGTHASGSYYNITKMASSMVINFGHTQNFDVWTQLTFGARFLDLNIGYQKTNTGDALKNFWIVNENMIVTPLKTVLQDIKDFALTSGEVIIINFGDFPIGFYKHPERHKIFLEALESEIGDLAYRTNLTNKSSYDLTVNEIVKANKNLLITYRMEEVVNVTDIDTNIMWPMWKKFTTSSLSDISEALDFMRLLFAKKPSSPVKNEGWIFFGIKGLEGSYGSGRKLQTTRERAAQINNKITNWIGGPWSLTANVVASDFFMGTNIVDIAIYTNRHKAFNIANNYTNFEIPL